MTDDPIITPIGRTSPVNSEEPALKRSFARDIDWLVCFTAMITAVVTFGLSAYFFFGFAQTDQGFWTLFSAFGLCFGVGALAYSPCVFIALIARRSAKNRASRRSLAFAVLLLMPWICVALIFIGWSALPKFYGVLALILSTALSVWAVSRLRFLPRR